MRGSVQSMAHIWAWKDANPGVEIPEGWEIDHLCYNPSCINPDHLECVPQQVNVQRAKDRQPKATHCKHGHEFTPENTYTQVLKDGREKRSCRECRKQADRERNERRKAGIAPTANSGKSHCANGHEFTPENTWMDAAGHRNCRTCRTERSRAYENRKFG
jgi:hypothetical protein